LARALQPLGVRLIDHLVVAGDRVTSFRALGLL
jgi:DNA repair protein RadC